MSKFYLGITLTGDFGSIECQIDEILSVLSAVDFDEISVSLVNQSEVENA